VDSEARLEKVIECLVALRDRWKAPVLVSTHPRTRLRIQQFGVENIDGIVFHEPFGYLDYNKLQLNALCVVSDSGTISEESAIMGFPAVSLRDSIERPESLDAGSIVLTGLDPANLLSGIDITLAGNQDFKPSGYKESNFSDVVVKFLLSTVTKHKKWLGIRESN
jgi:UDP-N-acetylglucosamine 2-epimerase (non-hydrolysing)